MLGLTTMARMRMMGTYKHTQAHTSTHKNTRLDTGWGQRGGGVLMMWVGEARDHDHRGALQGHSNTCTERET